MLLPALPIAVFARRLRRFRRDRDGSAAVEFAMIAPMFFALIFAIMETGLVFLGGQVLETGVQDASRLFYTNQSPTETQFKAAICNRISALMNCDNLRYDVRSYNPGTSITIMDPINGAGSFDGTSLTYQPPTSLSQTVVSRGFYQWPLYVTGIGYNIANLDRGKSTNGRLLTATNATGPQ